MRGQRLRGFNIALNVNQGTSVAGQSNVYSTNIQGIGFRIRTLGSNANTWPTGVGVFNAAAASVYIGWRQIQFDLVKTAAIVGNGQLTPGEYGRAQVSGNPFDQYFRVVVAGGSILTPPAASMPARKTSPCRSARSIARPFRARVPDGAQRFLVPAQLQFTAGRAREHGHDNHGRDRRPVGPARTLRLATAGPGPIAGGVGIQVRDALNNPVVFGQAVDVGPSQPAGYVVSFTARYIQTTGTVTAEPGQWPGHRDPDVQGRLGRPQWSWLLAAKPALLSTSITSWM